MWKHVLIVCLWGSQILLAQPATFAPTGWAFFPARDSVPALFEAQSNPAWLGQDRHRAFGLSYTKPFGLPGGWMMAGLQGHLKAWGWGGFFSAEQHPAARSSELMVASARRLSSQLVLGGSLLFQQQRIISVEAQRRVGARLGAVVQVSRTVSLSTAWNQRWLLASKSNSVIPYREWLVAAGYQASSHLRIEGSLVERGFGPAMGSLWLHVCPAPALAISGGFELPSGGYVMQVLLTRRAWQLALRVRHQQPVGATPALRLMYQYPTPPL